MVERFKKSGKLACFLAVRPPLTYHLADIDADGRVREFRSSDRSDMWINAGYFMLRPEIFDYMNEGEELVLEPFCQADRGRPAHGLQARGLLALHGQSEGPAGARGDGRAGQDALARAMTAPRQGRTLSIAAL